MKKNFIGIDVSKESLDVTMISVSDDGLTVEKEGYIKVENDAKGFAKILSFVRKNSNKRKSDSWLFCCETTGGYDNMLCKYLYNQGLDIWRESAKRISYARLTNGKDDRSDSRMIADYAMRNQDRFEPFKPRSEEQEALRQLVLFRRQLVNTRTQLIVRREEIEATKGKSKYLSFIYKSADKDIERLDSQIKECETEMVNLIKATKELSRNYRHLLSIPGIGLINAVLMLIYTDNFRPAFNSRNFASYCGIVPFYERSGTSVNKRSSIKGNSNKMLRSYLNQAANVASRTNPDMIEYKLRMMERGKPKAVIITNIANKLLHIAYSLVKNDCDYEKCHEKLRKGRIEKERNTKAKPNQCEAN